MSDPVRKLWVDVENVPESVQRDALKVTVGERLDVTARLNHWVCVVEIWAKQVTLPFIHTQQTLQIWAKQVTLPFIHTQQTNPTDLGQTGHPSLHTHTTN